MPIHFFCPNCGGLLSIARRKTGTTIRCPRCGSMQTVPPESEPAAREKARELRKHRKQESPTTTNAAAVVETDPSELRSQDRKPTDREIVASEPVASHLREESPTNASNSSQEKISPRRLKNSILISRSALGAYFLLLVATSLGTLFLGYRLGATESRGHLDAPPPTADRPAMPNDPILLDGKVFYAKGENTLIPDEEAVVLVVPADKRPAAPLSIEGFRTWENTSPAASVLESLESLGGRYTRVTADGTFSVVLPSPGKYKVLIVSRHLARSGIPDELALTQMGDWFARPDDLVGDREFAWLSWSAQPDQKPLVHTFQATDPLDLDSLGLTP
ncbi:MAG: hypothetical protein D6741_11685 [Planctomycetota bacterium]|nr:MAG: hypothetical protein D6741_11685 [Planctomycetota bacterium]